jgi:hypothetical protein
MKKRIMGLALAAIMGIGGVSAFAGGGVEVQSGNQRVEQRSERRQGNVNRNRSNDQRRIHEECENNELSQANKEARLKSVVEGLESAGKSDLAAKIQNGNFENTRDAINSLSEEEGLEVRELMRELRLNGNASGNRVSERGGSMGLCH